MALLKLPCGAVLQGSFDIVLKEVRFDTVEEGDDCSLSDLEEYEDYEVRELEAI